MAEDDQVTAGEDVADDAPQEEAQGSGTVLSGGGEDPAPVAPADWPEGWRAMMAGDDGKLAARLDRMKSPNDVFKAFLSADKTINSGKLKAELPEDPSDEQLAAYREANGIPEKPDGYLDLMEGIVPGEEDQALLGAFFETMHGANIDPKSVNAVLGWYFGQQEGLVAGQAEAENQARTATEDALRAEWGGEYRGNIQAMQNYLDGLPAIDENTGLGDLLAGARLADGTMLFAHPEAVQWFQGLVSDANPAGFVAPAQGTSQLQSVETEMKEIEAKMGTPAYTKDPAMQKRYLQLAEAQEKLSSRAA